MGRLVWRGSSLLDSEQLTPFLEIASKHYAQLARRSRHMRCCTWEEFQALASLSFSLVTRITFPWFICSLYSASMKTTDPEKGAVTLLRKKMTRELVALMPLS
jgi:hypothetical protein